MCLGWYLYFGGIGLRMKRRWKFFLAIGSWVFERQFVSSGAVGAKRPTPLFQVEA